MRTSATSAHSAVEQRWIKRGTQSVRVERAVVVLGWLIAVGLIFLLITHYRGNSESLTRDRVDTRNALTADFAADWVKNEAGLQRRLAELAFAGPSPTAADLREAGGILNSDATFLLDSDGRVISSLPDSDSLAGRRVAYRYSHLQQALDGKTAVSDVVLSAVGREPVVAIAVPFKTPYGERVLDAGFDINSEALNRLVQNKITIENSNFALVDSSGTPIAATAPDVVNEINRQALTSSLGEGREALSGIDDGTFYSLAPVPGTPWTLALTIPESSLYSSLAPPAAQWIVIALFALILGFVAVLFEVLLNSRRRVRLLANIDTLTRLPNRAFTTKLLCSELVDRPPSEPLSVLLIDIDYFKQINDRFGHAAGDEVLATLASRMQNALRPDDVIGRWGGEEFLAILKDTRLPTAERVAERLRTTIEADPVVFKETTLGVSISVGCVQAHDETLDQIVDRADLAMYQAKSSGRNVVVAA